MRFNWIEYDGEIAESAAKIIANRKKIVTAADFQEDIHRFILKDETGLPYNSK